MVVGVMLTESRIPRVTTAYSRQAGGRVGWQGIGTEFFGIVPRRFLQLLITDPEA